MEQKMSERVPAARRWEVQRTATGAGEEQKRAQGKGLMFLEMLPAKSSAEVCSAWQGTLEGEWAKEAADRNPHSFPSIPWEQCILLLLLLLLLFHQPRIYRMWDWSTVVSSLLSKQREETEQAKEQQWFVERKTEAQTWCESQGARRFLVEMYFKIWRSAK